MQGKSSQDFIRAKELRGTYKDESHEVARKDHHTVYVYPIFPTGPSENNFPKLNFRVLSVAYFYRARKQFSCRVFVSHGEDFHLQTRQHHTLSNLILL